MWLQNLKLITDLIAFAKSNFKRDHLKVVVFCVIAIVYFANNSIKKSGNQHYINASTENSIIRYIASTLPLCGDKSSIMIAAINLDDHAGSIRNFYSCDSKNCPQNTKEKNPNYLKNYVVDDSTYRYLKEVGKSEQVQTINLTSGDVITPLTKRRLKIKELSSLYDMLLMSDWFQSDEIKILKISAIVDFTNSVIFTISFTGKNECLDSDNFINSLKQIINDSRNKNEHIKFS